MPRLIQGLQFIHKTFLAPTARYLDDNDTFIISWLRRLLEGNKIQEISDLVGVSYIMEELTALSMIEIHQMVIGIDIKKSIVIKNVPRLVITRFIKENIRTDLLSGMRKAQSGFVETVYDQYDRLDETPIRSFPNTIKYILDKLGEQTDRRSALILLYQYLNGYKAGTYEENLGYNIRTIQRIKRSLINDDIGICLYNF